MPGPSFVASGNIATSQFRAVKLSAAASFEVSAITNANAEKPFGILQNDPDAAGKGAEVALVGEICKAEYGGNVDEGEYLSCDNDGKLIAAPYETSPATADLYIFALALEAGAASEIHYVLVLSPVLASTE